MTITICGSSAFRKKKVGIYDELIAIGHEAIIHPHYIESVKNGRTNMMDRIDRGEHAQLKIENDYIKWYYRAIKKSDAILVVNLEKGSIANYIGGNVLMEMGFAYVLDKRIYLLNPIPKLGYTDEIEAMQPIILNGNLNILQNNGK